MRVLPGLPVRRELVRYFSEADGTASATVILHRSEIQKLKTHGSALIPDIKRPKKVALATLLQAEQNACFLPHYARVAASPFPILSGDR